MKKKLALQTAILNIVIFSISYGQNGVSNIEPPVIERADVQFVDFKKQKVMGSTGVYPPVYHEVISGYVFKITLHLTTKQKPHLLDSLYRIVCIEENDSIVKLSIDRSNLIKGPSNELQHSFLYETKQKGWLKVMLAGVEEMQTDRNPEFYKNKSNTRLLYLRPPRIKER